jgi:hypothetical protein
LDPMVEGSMRNLVWEAQQQGFQVWWHGDGRGWRFVTPKGETHWFHPRTTTDVAHVLTVLESLGLDW